MLSDEPDLTAELDAADAIMMGHADKIETQWGVRYSSGRVSVVGASRTAERLARMDAASDHGTVVQRTVTYGPWEEVPGA